MAGRVQRVQRGHREGGAAKEGKFQEGMFFFEKKNQKTFARLLSAKATR
jgi:hypothetical protein